MARIAVRTKAKQNSRVNDENIIASFVAKVAYWVSASSFYKDKKEGWQVTIKELLNNAIAVCKNTVNPDIDITFDGKTLLYKNRGNAFTMDSLKTCMNYGCLDEFQLDFNNMYKTGLKTALSYAFTLNPYHFAIYAKIDGEFFVLRAVKNLASPDLSLKIVKLDKWMFGDFVTVIKTEVEPNKFPEFNDIKEFLELAAWSAISHYNVNVTFNGEEIVPVTPGIVLENEQKEGIPLKTLGGNCRINSTTFELSTLENGWIKSSKHRGFYIFTEGCLVDYSNVRIATKEENTSQRNELDGLATFIEIECDNKEAMPRMNSNKTNIRWDEEQEFRASLYHAVGGPYRKAMRIAAKNVAVVKEFLAPNINKKYKEGYAPAFSVSIAEGHNVSVQAAIFRVREEDEAFAEEILGQASNITLKENICNDDIEIEVDGKKIKKKRVEALMIASINTSITPTNVRDAGFALDIFKKKYGYTPKMFLVGNAINDAADKLIKEFWKGKITFLKRPQE